HLFRSNIVKFFFFVLDLFDVYFFFFQAEDCIRYSSVTGVQTCALPISWPAWQSNRQKNAGGRVRLCLRFGHGFEESVLNIDNIITCLLMFVLCFTCLAVAMLPRLAGDRPGLTTQERSREAANRVAAAPEDNSLHQ